jgi:flavin reductase (DIM6/NTAB) family NADH-FMN oxidoreductase RutF
MSTAPAGIAIQLDGDFTVDWIPETLEQGGSIPTTSGTVDGDTFKAAMRTLAGGVVIVTTRVEGRPWGLTISSCTSLTLDPPQILISLRGSATSSREIEARGAFGVSILSSEQRELAERGAAVGRSKFMDDVCVEGGRSRLSSPMGAGALFHLDCEVVAVHPVADHSLFVGSVAHAYAPESVGGRSPLMYFDRTFWGLGDRL